MPIEPPPTPWVLTRPPDDHPHDAWAFGADLEPGTVLGAYRLGVFPMRVDGELVWWSPPRRAVISIEGYSPSRSLRRASQAYEIRIDTAFTEVVAGCADPARPHGWIDDAFVSAYSRLQELGWVHSVEAWDDGGLAGGLYGVGVGGLFAAESKFHRRTGASKAALLALILHLQGLGGPRLLDVQWLTPHLASLGAAEITRAEYHARLDAALALPDAWGEPSASPHLREPADVVRQADHEQQQDEPDTDHRDALVDTT